MSSQEGVSDDYPYTNNLNIDPRLQGLQALLMPFGAFVSSQRGMMFASHSAQAMIPKGREMNKIFTGFEAQFGEYTNTTTKREQNIRIVANIPKYVPNVGMFPIKENPMNTVVFVGETDGMLDYFNITKYSKGADGHGYENIQENTHLLRPNQYVDKDVVFTHSPAVIDRNTYALGVNANVAYLSDQTTVEDAFCISQSFADKLTTTAIRTLNVSVRQNQIPLNLYGSKEEYKFMPDIGEVVNETGILCGFRTPSDTTFIADVHEQALSTPYPMHDTLFYAPPGATVIDVDFAMNRSRVQNRQHSKHMITQVLKYPIVDYYRRIVEVYVEYSRKGYKISPKMSTLVTKAISHLLAEGISVPGLPRSSPVLTRKNEPVEFIDITITYKFENKVTNGFKLTGGDGAKGVVCKIKPDEDMPVDDYGFRADIIINPPGVFNRLNPGQLYEQYLNRCSEFIRRRITAHVGDNRYDLAYGLFMEYINDINPNYAELINRTCATTDRQCDMMDQVIKEGIYLNVPMSLNTISPDLVRYLRDKYEIPLSPVEFNLRDEDGNVIRRVRTVDNVCIGSKYIYILCKIPHVISPGVGYINQFKTAIKLSSFAKQQYPISLTTVRWGEDEVRNQLMFTNDPEVVARIMCLYGNSALGVNTMVETLLTADKPTQVKNIDISTEHLVETNTVIGVAKHMLSVVGVDLSREPTEVVDRAAVILQGHI